MNPPKGKTSNEGEHTQSLILCLFKVYIMTREEIEQIVNNTIFTTKEVLTSTEAAQYMDISMSLLYKLTSRCEIPHYKPQGGKIYFNRKELEQWLQSNRIATKAELSDRANAYVMKGGAAI